MGGPLSQGALPPHLDRRIVDCHRPGRGRARVDRRRAPDDGAARPVGLRGTGPGDDGRHARQPDHPRAAAERGLPFLCAGKGGRGSPWLPERGPPHGHVGDRGDRIDCRVRVRRPGDRGANALGTDCARSARVRDAQRLQLPPQRHPECRPPAGHRRPSPGVRIVGAVSRRRRGDGVARLQQPCGDDRVRRGDRPGARLAVRVLSTAGAAAVEPGQRGSMEGTDLGLLVAVLHVRHLHVGAARVGPLGSGDVREHEGHRALRSVIPTRLLPRRRWRPVWRCSSWPPSCISDPEARPIARET